MFEEIFKYIPNFKGKRRLIRLLFGKRISGYNDILVNGKYNLKYNLPNCKEIIGFEILTGGIYEKETSDFICSKIPLNGVFLDIGANIGSISLPVSAKRSDIEIYCIEASSRVFGYLKSNFELNHKSTDGLINKAIADKDDLTVNFSGADDHFGRGHLSSGAEANNESVKTITIDTIIKERNLSKVDFIKIDIEGFEYLAFCGAKSILAGNDAPDILFEFEKWAEERADNINIGDSQRILLENNYKLFDYNINGGKRLIPVLTPLETGSHMIYATKKNIK